MRMTADVDVPEELVEAATSGSLVLFVGAGASVNFPSSLPLFDGLVAQIAELQGVAVDPALSPDAFLGRLADERPVVREQAKAIIGNSASEPNDMHRAIVRLAGACSALRVVTSNYDEHLSRAAEALSVSVDDIYFGPAVPLGREYRGFVYLHGAVSRPSRELILTDADFGRAYLTDGWARTFVQDLFVSRTVLFIGYSHNDVVMKYLARGLPTSTKRFVLTDEPDLPRWKDLRITPVRYPWSKDHSAAHKVLDAWADRLLMGQLDHRARVREIVKGSPPKLPVEADYLSYAITTPAGVRAFAEGASGPEWLRWIESQPVFKDLFGATPSNLDAAQVLARWFAHRYVETAPVADAALLTLARLGPTVSEDLIRAIGWSAYQLRSSAPDLTLKWYAVISAALQTTNNNSAESWPIFHDLPLSGASALPFLRRAIRPRLVLSERVAWFTDDEDGPQAVDASIAWSSSKSQIEALWKMVQADLDALAPVSLQILEEALRDAYELMAAFDGDRAFDPISFGRSSIEPHQQDQMRNFESTLIDGLRDAATLCMPTDPTLALRWIESPHELFRRLGIHLLTVDTSIGEARKVSLLIGGPYLYDHSLKHEVFTLLKTVGPALDRDSRTALLENILKGPPPFGLSTEAEATLHQRSIFDVVEWLGRFANEWPELDEAIAKIRVDRPDIGVRPHPDFGMWSESGIWGVKLPLEVDQFIALVTSLGVDRALGDLLSRDYSERNFDEPAWDDALSLIRQVVEKLPEIGVSILGSGTLPHDARRIDILAATVRGWARENPTDAVLTMILPHLTALVHDELLARPIAEVCFAAVGQNVDARSEAILVGLDDVVTRLWLWHSERYDHAQSEDWSFLGLNTWPGYVAQYWIHRIRLRWRAEGKRWQGLSFNESDSICMMLETTTAAGESALAVIASDAHFLFAADKTFTVEHLFPHFDNLVDDRARHAWMCYLYHPRTDESMLDLGFWDLLKQASSLVPMFNDRGLDSQYWRLVSWLSIFSTAQAVNPSELFRHLVHDDTGSGATRFVEGLVDTIGDSEIADVMPAWKKWIRETMRMRCEEVPGVVSASERSAWGDLALRMDGAVGEALQLSDKAPGPLTSRSTFDELASSLLDEVATSMATATTSRLRLTSTPDWSIEHELRALVPKLVSAGADGAAIRNLVESALAVGMNDAVNWIASQN